MTRDPSTGTPTPTTTGAGSATGTGDGSGPGSTGPANMTTEGGTGSTTAATTDDPGIDPQYGSGQIFCSGVCTDVSSDPNNCGKCEVACAGGETCGSGDCVDTEIPCPG